MHKPRLLVLAAAPIVCVLTASQVLADTLGAGPLVVVSGPSPFAGCKVGGTASSTLYPEAEVEPFVAVNPTDPNNAIGGSQQDRGPARGRAGLGTARLRNVA